MDALVGLGRLILGEDAQGVVLLLFVALGGALWAYWQEKKKNEKIAEQRLKEAREDIVLFVDTLKEATYTIKEFKTSNDALKIGFETIARLTMARPKGD